MVATRQTCDFKSKITVNKPGKSIVKMRRGGREHKNLESDANVYIYIYIYGLKAPTRILHICISRQLSLLKKSGEEEFLRKIHSNTEKLPNVNIS